MFALKGDLNARLFWGRKERKLAFLNFLPRMPNQFCQLDFALTISCNIISNYNA